MSCKINKNSKNGKINGVLNQTGQKSTLFQELFNIPTLSLDEAINTYKNIYSDKLKDTVKISYSKSIDNNIQQAIQKNNGNPLNLAPNGKPSILYQSYKDLGYSDSEAERLTAQVYSDEFISWFGDWVNDPQNSSKVVDENGQPLVVYHGGEDNLFTVFSKSDVKDGGFFFSNSIKMASSYGSDLIINSIEDASFKKLSDDIQSNLNYINSLLDESSDDYSNLEVSYSIQGFPGLFETIQESIEEAQFLKEENPNKYTKDISVDNIEITLSVVNYSTNENYNGDFLFKNGVASVFDDFISNLPDDIQEVKSQRDKVSGVRPFFLVIKNTETVDGGRKNWDKIKYGEKTVKTRDIVSDLFSKGKDGVIIQNIYDYASYVKNPTAEDIFVAFNPNQIKSATDNIGTFSTESNDIRYQIIGEKGAQNLDQIEEATFRMDNLAVARLMEESGKTPLEIKIATGWERGAGKIDAFDRLDEENAILELLNNNIIQRTDC